MAVSRVEKFKEYRKSIISGGTIGDKEAIDTKLTSVESDAEESISDAESYLLKKLLFKKRLDIILFSVVIGVLVIGLLVFGVIALRG